MTQILNSKQKHIRFSHSDFGFGICFGFRASDLGFF
jgi:hypothetical protein